MMRISRALLSFSLLLSLSCLIHAQTAQPMFQSQVVEPTYQFTISWAIEEPDIILTASAQCNCWIAIGWHREGSSDTKMTNADIVVATFDEMGSATVTNYWAITTHPPSPNPTPAVLQGSGYQMNGYSFLQFRRPLVTNSTTTNNDINVNGTTNFIWAHGNTASSDANQFNYHGHTDTNRGEVDIDLATGVVTIPKQKSTWLAQWHGTLMTFAFGFCLSFGVFSARYLKYYYWWFPLHIITQVSGTLCAIAAFILAFIMSEGNHFKTIHSFFGISVLSLAVLSCVLGATSHFMYNPHRSKIPVFPDQLHWWVARLCVAASYASIILGMRQLGVPIQLVYVFSGLVAFYIIIYIYLDIYSWKTKKQSGDYLTPHINE
eukprot:TRINITY_DN13509_c0_g1_i1.p1 TRINITY_DN13509_c0_g1~~TRINITY_DN13509_c0_g1_i1.p1  ORF type:complete len:376 (-),score=67.31 TRINITY_DN13509_c0_g1_i1:128-1255(-)